MSYMRKTDYSEAVKAKFPEPVALAVSFDAKNKRPDIITLGWVMCTSNDPPMLAVSIGHTRHSLETIRKGGEFVLAFPAADQARESLFCGSCSGRDHDKFAECDLEPLPATAVKPPLIEGACANFECKVVASCESGDHTIFVGEVVASHVSDPPKPRLYTLPDGTLGGVMDV